MPRYRDPYLEAQRQRLRMQREQAAEARRREAERKRRERKAKLDHVGAMQAEAEDRTQLARDRVSQLQELLKSALARSWALDFDKLKRPRELPRFDPKGLDRPGIPAEISKYLPTAPSLLARFWPGAMKRHNLATLEAQRCYERDLGEYAERERGREQQLAVRIAIGKSTTVARNLGEIGIGLTASPDGRTILYTRVDSSVDDLMLVEDFR